METETRRVSALVTTAIITMLFCPQARAAWDFVPTQFEWQMWPEYCRVQYTLFGDPLPFEDYSSAKVGVQSWRATIGAQTFNGLHHYCASIHFLARARSATDPRSRSFLLARAWSDAEYSYSRADPQSPVFPAMSVTAARIKLELGKNDDAVDILKRSIESQPKGLEAYMMLAVIYRKEAKLGEALAVMNQADTASGGNSPEIQYNLGLINMELGNLDAAVLNARNAYDKGYPLPGLKQKLMAKGIWNEDN